MLDDAFIDYFATLCQLVILFVKPYLPTSITLCNVTKCHNLLTECPIDKRTCLQIVLLTVSCWQNIPLTKELVDKMSRRQNVLLTKCLVDKMSCWQNVLLTKYSVDKMFNWQNVSLTKCLVDKMACWKYFLLTKCLIDKMSCWQNCLQMKCSAGQNAWHPRKHW